jgi:hypothetical protein
METTNRNIIFFFLFAISIGLLIYFYTKKEEKKGADDPTIPKTTRQKALELAEQDKGAFVIIYDINRIIHYFKEDDLKNIRRIELKKLYYTSMIARNMSFSFYDRNARQVEKINVPFEPPHFEQFNRTISDDFKKSLESKGIDETSYVVFSYYK